jgi:hypothetical protein
LLEVPKDAKRWFVEMVWGHMLPRIKAGWPILRVSDGLISAAVERSRRAENRRIKSNLRYERNHVATKRKEEEIMLALEARLRFRMRIESAAHWLNEQVKLCEVEMRVLFAGRSTDKYSVRRRLQGAGTVHDYYRDMHMFYTWRRGLPCPVFNGHETEFDIARLNAKVEADREKKTGGEE